MSLFEPECVGAVDAEERPRLPVVEPLLGDVAQLDAGDDRLRNPAHYSDGELLLGVDREHALPDSPALLLIECRAPLLIEFQQLDRFRNVGLDADRTAGLEELPELRPLQVLLARRCKHVRAHVGGRNAVLETGPDRHHRLAGENPVAERLALRRLAEELDADLAPRLADELEDVGLLGALAS